MEGTVGELERLTHSEQRALRNVLIAAVAAVAPSGRSCDDLERLIDLAPIRALPAAAALHRVTGSVLRGLDGIDGLPDDVRREMTATCDRASLHHLVVAGALSEIASAFDAAALQWVVMKGPVVAAMLYPSARDRSYADLDLLVARVDFARAMSLLEQIGYRPAIRNWALAEKMLAGQVEMQAPSLHVDLHWALHYSRQDRRPYGFVPDAMIARSRRVDVAGVKVPTIDAPDTLVTLAFHAARSDGHRLLWLKDIERALAVDRPDLDVVSRRAREYRCAPAVGVMLRRARSILGADVPERALRAVTPRSIRAADRVVTTAVYPIQLHDRVTVTRLFTRSLRSSPTSSLGHLPARAFRATLRAARPPAPNETDDPAEKASFLAAVAASSPPPGSP